MPDDTVRQVFQGRLEKDDDGGVFIAVPFDVKQVFGTSARLPVRGTINDYPFRGSLFPYGQVHYLGVNKALQEAAGVKPGQVVEVAVEWDDAPRELHLPADLAQALSASPAAQAAWDRLSFTRRRENVLLVEGAKKPETRLRRIEKILAELATKP